MHKNPGRLKWTAQCPSFILINSNDSLINLDGLANLTSAGSISLTENISLPEAESEALLRRLGL